MKDLVLIHGWGMNNELWSSVLEELSALWILHPLELPGHGHAPMTSQSLDSWTEYMRLRAPTKAVWLGWSLGGAIALNLALTHPESVEKLIMVSSTPCFVQKDDWPYGMAPELLKGFSDELLIDVSKTILHFLGLQLRGSTNEKVLLKSLRQKIRQSPEAQSQALMQGLAILVTTDLRSKLKAVQCPSLWLFGGKDKLVAKENARQIPKLWPKAQVELWDDAAHTPFLSHPGQFITLLKDFIDA